MFAHLIRHRLIALHHRVQLGLLRLGVKRFTNAGQRFEQMRRAERYRPDWLARLPKKVTARDSDVGDGRFACRVGLG